MIAERNKYFKYNKLYGGQYFWRTAQQQEIDYLEERDGQIATFEFKWNEKKVPQIPKIFQNAYSESTYKVINPSNYNEFLT